MTEPDQPATSDTETAFRAAAAASALNGATAHQNVVDEPAPEPAPDTGQLDEIQTAIGVLQVQMAVALALALLSLSILTYSLKRGVGLP